jgi:hypothetical protein
VLGQSIAWPLVVLLLHAPALLAMHAAFPSAWKHVHVCCMRCRRSKTQPHLYTRLQCGPHSRNPTRCTHGSNHVISGPCVYGDTHTHTHTHTCCRLAASWRASCASYSTMMAWSAAHSASLAAALAAFRDSLLQVRAYQQWHCSFGGSACACTYAHARCL